MSWNNWCIRTSINMSIEYPDNLIFGNTSVGFIDILCLPSILNARIFLWMTLTIDSFEGNLLHFSPVISRNAMKSAKAPLDNNSNIITHGTMYFHWLFLIMVGLQLDMMKIWDNWQKQDQTSEHCLFLSNSMHNNDYTLNCWYCSNYLSQKNYSYEIFYTIWDFFTSTFPAWSDLNP